MMWLWWLLFWLIVSVALYYASDSIPRLAIEPRKTTFKSAYDAGFDFGCFGPSLFNDQGKWPYDQHASWSHGRSLGATARGEKSQIG